MKNLGQINEPKDIVTKDYVDTKIATLVDKTQVQIITWEDED